MAEAQNIVTVKDAPHSLLSVAVDTISVSLSRLDRKANNSKNSASHARRAKILSNINTWLENIEPLITCLEKIARLHPAIGGLQSC